MGGKHECTTVALMSNERLDETLCVIEVIQSCSRLLSCPELGINWTKCCLYAPPCSRKLLKYCFTFKYRDFSHTRFPCSQLSQLWSSIHVSKRMFASWMNQLEPPERVSECLTAVSSVSLSAVMHVFFIVRAHTSRAVEKASGIRLTSLLQR